MSKRLNASVWIFLDQITADITNIQGKLWLRTALVSHTHQAFRRQGTREEIELIVHGWLCRED